MNNIACAITGHRPTRFKFQYQENDPLCQKIKHALAVQIASAYEDGMQTFLIGGALGVDMWAGEIILKMKAELRYADIRLICALPFKGHDQQWDENNRNRMKGIIAACDGVVVLCDAEEHDAYKKRNVYMVSSAERLIAVFDATRKPRSGTGQTVNYAKKLGLRIIYINPDTADISE